MRLARLIPLIGFSLALACVPGKEQESVELAPPPEVEECLFETAGGSLIRGETPAGWAIRQGVDAGTAQKMLAALAVYLPSSRYRTDDRLEITRNPAGGVLSFAVERESGERFIARREGEAWAASAETKPIRREIAHFRGTIRSSLWESLIEEGASPDLVVRFADIFSWTFDFLTDCREGDRFDLIAEAIYQEGEFRRHGDVLAARYDGERGKVAGILFRPEGGKAAYFAPDGSSLQKAFLRSPLSYRRISSGFSHRRFHPVLKRYMPHLGIDYAAAAGTPVVTIGEGTVAFAGWKRGFGKIVEVRHPRSYTTTYGHLSRYAQGIRAGARVGQGQVIGYVGSTGLATGPHLDFRMKRGPTYVNPLKIEIPSADPVPPGEERAFFHLARVCLAALDVLPEGSIGAEREPLVLALLSGADRGFLPANPGLDDHPAP
ncbi:MAG: M23 family metallopeptidase [Candidatus Eisenbacteria bacterium]